MSSLSRKLCLLCLYKLGWDAPALYITCIAQVQSQLGSLKCIIQSQQEKQTSGLEVFSSEKLPGFKTRDQQMEFASWFLFSVKTTSKEVALYPRQTEL